MNDVWQFVPGFGWIQHCRNSRENGNGGNSADCGAAPTQREMSDLTSIGSTLYLFGGSSRSHDFNDLWEIKPFSDWVQLCADDTDDCGVPPDRRRNFALEAIGSDLIVFGGRLERPSVLMNDFWMISPDGNRQWMEMCQDGACGELPTERNFFAAATISTSHFIFGGEVDGSRVSGDLWQFGE